MVGAPISAPQPTRCPLVAPIRQSCRTYSWEAVSMVTSTRCRPSSVGRGPPVAASSWLLSPSPDPPAPGYRRPGRGGACGLPASRLVAAGVSGLLVEGRTFGRCPRWRGLACKCRWPTLSPCRSTVEGGDAVGSLGWPGWPRPRLSSQGTARLQRHATFLSTHLGIGALGSGRGAGSSALSPATAAVGHGPLPGRGQRAWLEGASRPDRGQFAHAATPIGGRAVTGPA